MHGIKRSRKMGVSDPAKEAVKRREEEQKIAQYQELEKKCLDARDAAQYDADALGMTHQLLDFNPEYYTVWNFRRRILLDGLFPSRSPEEVYQLLSNDLRLTLSYLKVHPKVYWIWTHRKWCLENIPLGPPVPTQDDQPSSSALATGLTEGWRNETWGRELMTVEKMLQADSRNFHAWNYRRYVLASLPKSFKPLQTSQTEIRFTTAKIEANFSNFSAWHQRTRVLESMWAEMDKAEVQQMRKKEFDLVTQALWTDPADQSGWLYHRWLIGDGSDEETLKREIDMIRELLEAEPDSKWPLDTLVHYCSILRKRTASGEERSALKTEIQSWLSFLCKIDPYRRGRYTDIGSSLESTSDSGKT